MIPNLWYHWLQKGDEDDRKWIRIFIPQCIYGQTISIYVRTVIIKRLLECSNEKTYIHYTTCYINFRKGRKHTCTRYCVIECGTEKRNTVVFLSSKAEANQIVNACFYAIKIRNCQIIKSRLKAIWLICKWCYMNQTNIAFRYIRILWICDLVFQRALLYHKMNLFYSKYFTLFLCKGHKNHLTTK